MAPPEPTSGVPFTSSGTTRTYKGGSFYFIWQNQNLQVGFLSLHLAPILEPTSGVPFLLLHLAPPELTRGGSFYFIWHHQNDRTYKWGFLLLHLAPLEPTIWVSFTSSGTTRTYKWGSFYLIWHHQNLQVGFLLPHLAPPEPTAVQSPYMDGDHLERLSAAELIYIIFTATLSQTTKQIQ